MENKNITLTNAEIEENKQEFIDIYTKMCGERQGAIALLDWLLQSTFFEDPASTNYHENYAGGLVEHSLRVYNVIFDLAYELYLDRVSSETLAIISLLHDVCKIGCYKKVYKNVKSYEEDDIKSAQKYQIKNDSMGNFIWKTVEGYMFEDDFPLGHGEKSLFLVQRFIPLTNEEALAIRYHMGAWDLDDKRGLSKAFETTPLAVLLHMADTAATYL